MGKRIEDEDFDSPSNEDEINKDAGDKIIESLGKYPYQTSQHLCANTGLSIEIILDWLDGNGDEVSSEQVGSVWVYYLPENHPARRGPPIKLYFGGPDGRMICFREEAPRGNTGNLKVGGTFVFERQSSSADDPGAKKTRQLSPDIDLEELEELATINPNQKSIADALDVGHSQLVVWIRDRREIRQAYERGAAKHKKAEDKPQEKTKMEEPRKINEPKTPDAPSPSPSQSSAKGGTAVLSLRTRLTVEVLENAGKTGISTAKLAEQFGLDPKNGGKQIDAILYNPKHADLKSAWKRGKAMREAFRATVKPTVRQEKAQEKTAATDFIIPEKPAAEAKLPIELPPVQNSIEKAVAQESEHGTPVGKQNEQSKDPEPDQLKEPKTPDAPSPSPSQSSAKGGTAVLSLRTRLTVEVLENAGKTGISTAKLAEQFGLDPKNGGKQIDAILYNPKHADLKSAWKRGKAMREAFRATVKPTVRQEKAQEKTAATDFIIPEKPAAEAKLPIELPPVQNSIEKAVAQESEHGTPVGKQNEQSKDPEPDQLKEPKRPDNFYDHRENFGEDKLPANWKIVPELELPSDFAERFERQSLELRREKIEEVKDKLMTAPKSFGGEVNILGAFASCEPDGLTLKFKGDFFNLPGKQRRLLCEMAALNDEFQEEN